MGYEEWDWERRTSQRNQKSQRSGSSSDYSSSSPPRGRKRRCHYDSSSSDYSSSDSGQSRNESKSRERLFSTNQSVPRPATTAVGRKLNVSREANILQRDCQFVKRIITTDPSLSNSREKVNYLTGDEVIPLEKDQGDPRTPQNVYLAQCAAGISKNMKTVQFVWDAQSQSKEPPCQVILRNFPENIISKALLVNLIKAASDADTAEAIVDVQLTPGVAALLKMRDPTAASIILKKIGKKPIGNDVWSVAFDEDGREYRQLTSKSESKDKEIKKQPEEPPLLKCSRNVPCIVIPYSVVPSDESRALLEDIFRKCRLYNVERSGQQWHVHLLSDREVEWVWRHREEFRWRGKAIEMDLQLNGRPYRIEIKKSEIEESLTLRNPTVSNESGQRTSSSILSRQESRVSLDSLFMRPPVMGFLHSRTSSETVSIPAEPGQAIEDQHADLGSLPTFNKRVIARQKAEEEAAAIAAEEARVEMDKKLAGVEERRRKRREKEKKRQGAHLSSRVDPVVVDDKDMKIPTLVPHESGSSRTEGFYRQRPLEKIVYLEDINAKISQMTSDPTVIDRAATSASRSNRAQNRRLQLTLDQVDSDLFGKTTAFAARRKKVILGRSSIHSWGLFAGEDIETGQMVCEYVGEIIRHTVANVRERRYELALRAKGSTEMASSYFFRLDDTMVVDATHKGNLSRFINHCCDPNCVAKILTSDRRRIVMYARRDIRRGEEVTYDYKFPLEDDLEKKIRCLCGARSCRGYLN